MSSAATKHSIDRRWIWKQGTWGVALVQGTRKRGKSRGGEGGGGLGPKSLCTKHGPTRFVFSHCGHFWSGGGP